MPADVLLALSCTHRGTSRTSHLDHFQLPQTLRSIDPLALRLARSAVGEFRLLLATDARWLRSDAHTDLHWTAPSKEPDSCCHRRPALCQKALSAPASLHCRPYLA